MSDGAINNASHHERTMENSADSEPLVTQLDKADGSTTLRLRHTEYQHKLQQVLSHHDILHHFLQHLPTLEDRLHLAYAYDAEKIRVNLLLDGAVADEVSAMPNNTWCNGEGMNWREWIDNYLEEVGVELRAHAEEHSFYQNMLKHAHREIFKPASYGPYHDLVRGLRNFTKPWWASNQMYAQVHMIFVKLQACRDDRWTVDMTALLEHIPQLDKFDLGSPGAYDDIEVAIQNGIDSQFFFDAWEKKLGSCYDGAAGSTWRELLELTYDGQVFEQASHTVKLLINDNDLDYGWWTQWCVSVSGAVGLYSGLVLEGQLPMNIEMLSYFLHCSAEQFFFSLLMCNETSERLTAYLDGRSRLGGKRSKRKIHFRYRDISRGYDRHARLFVNHDLSDRIIGHERNWRMPCDGRFIVSPGGALVIEEVVEGNLKKRKRGADGPKRLVSFIAVRQ